MDYELTPENLAFIEDSMLAGRYGSVDDVVNAAIELLRAKDGDPVIPPEQIERLKREVAKGIAAADRGEFVEFSAESVIAEEHRRLEDRQRQRQQAKLRQGR